MQSLKNKRIIITGGSRGIGKAIATKCLENGAFVVICARDAKEVQSSAHELDPSGKKLSALALDISKPASAKKAVEEAINKLGGIDVLINVAGIIGEVGELEKVDPDKWLDAITVNLGGTAFMSMNVIPLFKKSGQGKIINFAGAGVGGKKPMPNFSAYYSSKIAVVGLTETMAAELAPFNIDVNAVAPGAINTAITDYTLAQGPEKVGKEAYEKIVGQKKGGGDSLEAAVSLVTFLASDESNGITGRLFSAKWDKLDKLKSITDSSSDIFKLRRIDNDLFLQK